ncbi:MAG: hypothetical protein LBR79_06990 [Oscillospiraceae bacterium]|nr:hypothetical protein [Oscillospiraceae bacterium]
MASKVSKESIDEELKKLCKGKSDRVNGFKNENKKFLKSILAMNPKQALQKLEKQFEEWNINRKVKKLENLKITANCIKWEGPEVDEKLIKKKGVTLAVLCALKACCVGFAGINPKNIAERCFYMMVIIILQKYCDENILRLQKIMSSPKINKNEKRKLELKIATYLIKSSILMRIAQMGAKFAVYANEIKKAIKLAGNGEEGKCNILLKGITNEIRGECAGWNSGLPDEYSDGGLATLIEFRKGAKLIAVTMNREGNKLQKIKNLCGELTKKFGESEEAYDEINNESEEMKKRLVAYGQ